jgi:hypothetical protein
MVDRVYQSDLPQLRKALADLKARAARLGSRTDWANLRVAPVLAHAENLERLLKSRTHAREIARLHKGVALFHSDLVYLRTNVKLLEQLVESEARSAVRRAPRK